MLASKCETIIAKVFGGGGKLSILGEKLPPSPLVRTLPRITTTSAVDDHFADY